MTIGVSRARRDATLSLTLLVSATAVSGCGGMYTMNQIDKPKDPLTMEVALDYSNRMKEEAVRTADTPFSIGQGLNGVLIGAIGAATALLAFDGNQAAAAGVGLGAGALGLTDRFLLIDESLALYKNAVESLNCAESLLVPLASIPNDTAGGSVPLAAMSNMTMLMETPNENTAFMKDAGQPVGARAAVAAVSPTVVAATAARVDLLGALMAASDAGTVASPNMALSSPGIAAAPAAAAAGKTGADTAAKRLVLFANQVRATVNSTVLTKRATTEELSGSFKTIVADYVANLDKKKKEAKQENDKAKAAQEATVMATAAANAGRIEAETTKADRQAAAQNAQIALVQLAETGRRIEENGRLIEAIGANIPDEEKIQACLVKVAGGSGSGGAPK
ncbi:hypothetical protein [Dongia sp. agr-C8]